MTFALRASSLLNSATSSIAVLRRTLPAALVVGGLSFAPVAHAADPAAPQAPATAPQKKDAEKAPAKAETKPEAKTETKTEAKGDGKATDAKATAAAAATAKEEPKAAPAAPAPKALPPELSGECAWTGKRVVSLLARDDVDQAKRFMEFYRLFNCKEAHIAPTFRCVIAADAQPAPAGQEVAFADRVDHCWESGE